jgi:hypothetical protein
VLTSPGVQRKALSSTGLAEREACSETWNLSINSIFALGLTKITENLDQNQSYVTADGPSASLSWCQAPIWGLRQDFYYRQTVDGLLMWGALSDERTGLSFTTADGPRHRSHIYRP